MSVAKAPRYLLSLITVLWLIAPSPAHALSCRNAAEEQLYGRSEHIFTAQIVSQNMIGLRNDKDRYDRRKVSYGLKILEEFKGSVDYDSFVSNVAWDADTALLAVGETNLFFMGKTPGFGDCSRRYRLDLQRTQLLLQRLREVRDGLVDSFEGSWHALESETHCSLAATYPIIDQHHTLHLTLSHRKGLAKSSPETKLHVVVYPRTGALHDRDSRLFLTVATERSELENQSLDHATRSEFSLVLESPELLLHSILRDQPVHVDTDRFAEQISVLLNGGLPHFEEFARCSSIDLQIDDPIAAQ